MDFRFYLGSWKHYVERSSIDLLLKRATHQAQKCWAWRGVLGQNPNPTSARDSVNIKYISGGTTLTLWASFWGWIRPKLIPRWYHRANGLTAKSIFFSSHGHSPLLPIYPLNLISANYHMWYQQITHLLYILAM